MVSDLPRCPHCGEQRNVELVAVAGWLRLQQWLCACCAKVFEVPIPARQPPARAEVRP